VTTSGLLHVFELADGRLALLVLVIFMVGVVTAPCI
jgi:hypothetical protein